MVETVQFELVAPEKLIFTGEVELVVVPGAEGDFGVLPGHANLISTVRPGIVEIYESNQVKERYFVGGGYAEVTSKRCTVLSTESMQVSEIDTNGAQERLNAAESDLSSATSETDRSRAERSLEVARALVEASQN